ncbi:hypothetical protein ANANG_G00042110 [Anguilla anguilla]|uniref:Uncharacterized protein n=1 Tax=Anguilla anguilla TaxID=7936 RepID=A0A9D3MW36_ANGAN|nr:hypothetical protein ANANG_G00042110 [Anguilla anguilla]
MKISGVQVFLWFSRFCNDYLIPTAAVWKITLRICKMVKKHYMPLTSLYQTIDFSNKVHRHPVKSQKSVSILAFLFPLCSFPFSRFNFPFFSLFPFPSSVLHLTVCFACTIPSSLARSSPLHNILLCGGPLPHSLTLTFNRVINQCSSG